MGLDKILLEEYKKRKVNLLTVSEDVIKADIIRKMIYRRADFIAQGTKLVGLQAFNNLDVKYQFPSAMTVAYPVAEGARGVHGKITWTDFTFSLGKAEGSFMITDEARVRGYDNLQYTTGVKRLSEALAKEKDDNIVESLLSGAGNSAAASQTWDGGSATAATISADIQAGLKNIMGAEGVTEQDINNTALVVPLAAWSSLLKLTQIDTLLRTTMKDWIQSTFGMTIHPTKNAAFADTGMIIIKGEDTAVHGTLSAPAGVPLVETERHTGVGLEYVVRQFFATKVVPDSASTATSSRIYTITNICA